MSELFEQIGSAVDPAERRDLSDSLISELVRHSVAEEMYVYPAMREHLPTATLRWTTTRTGTSSSRR